MRWELFVKHKKCLLAFLWRFSSKYLHSDKPNCSNETLLWQWYLKKSWPASESLFFGHIYVRLCCFFHTFTLRWVRPKDTPVNLALVKMPATNLGTCYLQNQPNNVWTSYLQNQLLKLNHLKTGKTRGGQSSLMVRSCCRLNSKKISGSVISVDTGLIGSGNTSKLTLRKYLIGQQQTTSAMKFPPWREGG